MGHIHRETQIVLPVTARQGEKHEMLQRVMPFFLPMFIDANVETSNIAIGMNDRCLMWCRLCDYQTDEFWIEGFHEYRT